MSPSAVSRIWRAFALQPHRSETFKLSRDPLFIEKGRDIVGLYLNPPERALGLGVDDKAQIQALDRTQPLLPMQPGQIERRITTMSATAPRRCLSLWRWLAAESSARFTVGFARSSSASFSTRSTSRRLPHWICT